MILPKPRDSADDGPEIRIIPFFRENPEGSSCPLCRDGYPKLYSGDGSVYHSALEADWKCADA